MVVTILYNTSINKGDVNQLNLTFNNFSFAQVQMKATKKKKTKTHN